MITVASFDNTEQAELLKAQLENAGIQAFVADAAVVSLNWLYSNAVGGVKVQVHEDDLDRAKVLLEEWQQQPEDSAALSEYKCPKCGSTKVELRKISMSFFMLSLLVLGIPLAFYRPRCHCLACGKTWKMNSSTTSPMQADHHSSGR